MPTKTTSLLLGLFVSPLPMAIIFLLIAIYSDSLSGTQLVVGFAVGYVFVLIPLLISKSILRLASRQSRRSHFWGMFIVTFLPMLSVYRFVDLEPDFSFSYQLNSGETQVIEFAVAGVLIAAVMALLNAACMLIFWRIAVRSAHNAAETH